jgi:hypothetical protein
MNQNEFKEFGDLLKSVAEYYRQTLSGTTIRFWWNALGNFPLPVLEKLFDAHVKTSKFMPSISEILDAIRAMDGRPNPEEAWAICARGLNDENVTVVWTAEIAQAFGVALGLKNDRIAARMAFKESYENDVKEARSNGLAAVWSASLGHDVAGREGPLALAVKQGRLSAAYAAGLLPYRAEPSEQVRALSEGAVKKITSPNTEKMPMPNHIRAALGLTKEAA